MLGGLIEDKYTENRSKVPLLGDIPYLGALFRSESRQKTRTNLMVFLRPVVMRDADTANRLSLDRYEQMRGFQKDMQPKPSVLVPINDSPVIPPTAAGSTTPANRWPHRKARPGPHRARSSRRPRRAAMWRRP